MRPAYALALILCASCSCSPTAWEAYEACGPDATGISTEDWYVHSARWGDENEGFDLDGENTQCRSGCIEDARDGVDNRMGAVVKGLRDSLGEWWPCSFLVCAVQPDIDEGNLVMLFSIQSGRSPEDARCRNAFLYNGVDLDGDPSNNDSGTEPFDVTTSSLIDPREDLMRDARFLFDEGGVVRGDTFRPEPAAEVVMEIRLPDGGLAELPFVNAHLRFEEDRTTMSGMLAGFIPVADLATYMQAHAEAMGDIDPETMMNIVLNQADADLQPEGATDDECTTADECPLPWQDCGADGYCIEPDDRMDAISATLVFEAVPCTITGIAEE
jgi:hypothetical protein